jgi:8-oxo-dGTP diphosphatase
MRQILTFSLFFLLLSAAPAQWHRPPILTTTAIAEVHDGEEFIGIVLIERGKAPFGKALPGGKVEYGKTVEQAVRRKMLEEIGLELDDLKQFHVYSDPEKDFRHHSVEVTHLAKAYSAPMAGDDAAEAFVVSIDQIPCNEMTFDHGQILRDYIEYSSEKKAFIAKP